MFQHQSAIFKESNRTKGTQVQHVSLGIIVMYLFYDLYFNVFYSIHLWVNILNK